ncbi:MAG: hypothetical protein QNJ97_24360 [Myxococcota bacterium]|nr:hypothetical protein [Myxococcota bacterium]
MPLKIARMYCPKGQTTVGLIPDFLASHITGTLQDIEEAVATYELLGSLTDSADAVRPPGMVGDNEEPVTLDATTRWLGRRAKWVTGTLMAVAGMFPQLFSLAEPTIQSFRAHLDTESVLVELRRICSDRLLYFPYPLGFGPRVERGRISHCADQQSTCRDRPP